MKDKLKELHQKARLARDPFAAEAYGAALASIQESEVRENREFDEAKQLQIVEKEVGKFKESSEFFSKAGRAEKANDLQQCAELLMGLLPAKLNELTYPDLVAKAIVDTGASNMKEMGTVMAALKKEHGTSLDMKVASQQVKSALS